jgi:hypothetical protein
MKVGVKDGHLRRRHDEMWYDNQQKRGKQEERRQQTRGGGALHGGGGSLGGGDGMLRGQEAAAAAQQQGQCNNQLANKRLTGGRASTDKRRQIVQRTRSGSGSGATIGIMTTSRRHQRTIGGGILKAGGTSRRWEVEVAWQDDKRRRWHVLKTTGGVDAARQVASQQPARAN